MLQYAAKDVEQLLLLPVLEPDSHVLFNRTAQHLCASLRELGFVHRELTLVYPPDSLAQVRCAFLVPGCQTCSDCTHTPLCSRVCAGALESAVEGCLSWAPLALWGALLCTLWGFGCVVVPSQKHHHYVEELDVLAPTFDGSSRLTRRLFVEMLSQHLSARTYCDSGNFAATAKVGAATGP